LRYHNLMANESASEFEPQPDRDQLLVELAIDNPAYTGLVLTHLQRTPPPFTGFCYHAPICDLLELPFRSLPLESEVCKELRTTTPNTNTDKVSTLEYKVQEVLRPDLERLFRYQREFLTKAAEEDRQLSVVYPFIRALPQIVTLLETEEDVPISWQKAEIMANGTMTERYGGNWREVQTQEEVQTNVPLGITRAARLREQAALALKYEAMATERKRTSPTEREAQARETLKILLESTISRMMTEDIVYYGQYAAVHLARTHFANEPGTNPIPVTIEEFKQLSIHCCLDRNNNFMIIAQDPSGTSITLTDKSGLNTRSGLYYVIANALKDKHITDRQSLETIQEKYQAEMRLSALNELIRLYELVALPSENVPFTRIVEKIEDLNTSLEEQYFLKPAFYHSIWINESIACLVDQTNAQLITFWKLLQMYYEDGNIGELIQRNLQAHALGRPSVDQEMRRRLQLIEKAGSSLNQQSQEEKTAPPRTNPFLTLNYQPPEMRNLTGQELEIMSRKYSFVIKGDRELLATIPPDLTVNTSLRSQNYQTWQPEPQGETGNFLTIESQAPTSANLENGVISLVLPPYSRLARLEVETVDKTDPAVRKPVNQSSYTVQYDSVCGSYRIIITDPKLRPALFTTRAEFQPAEKTQKEKTSEITVNNRRFRRFCRLLKEKGLKPLAESLEKTLGGKKSISVEDIVASLASSCVYSYDEISRPANKDTFKQFAAFYDPETKKYRIQCSTAAKILESSLQFLLRGQKDIQVGIETCYIIYDDWQGNSKSIFKNSQGEYFIIVKEADRHARVVLTKGNKVYRLDATPCDTVVETKQPAKFQSFEAKKQAVAHASAIGPTRETYTPKQFEPVATDLAALAEKYLGREPVTGYPDSTLSQVVARLSASDRATTLQWAQAELEKIGQTITAIKERLLAKNLQGLRLAPRFRKLSFVLQLEQIFLKLNSQVQFAGM